MAKIVTGFTNPTLPDPPQKARSKKYQDQYKATQEANVKKVAEANANALVTNNMNKAIPDKLEKASDEVEEKASKSDSDKVTASRDDALGTNWDATMVWNYLTGFTNIQLRMNRLQITKDLADDANNISGTQATNLVETYIVSGYAKNTTWNLQFNNVMNADIGGGQPDTGTNKLGYKAWVVIIQQYYDTGSHADEQAYMIACKGYFRNISDETLFELWNAWDSVARNTDISDKASLKGLGLTDTDIAQKIWLSKASFDDIVSVGEKNSANISDNAPEDIRFFTQLLYNWYCENPNFYSGTLVLAGDPNYRIGMTLSVEDEVSGETYEFYVESVEHTFSFDEGYQTIVEVTRGLPNNGDQRFSHLWNQNRDFVGGLMGESTLQYLAQSSDLLGKNGTSTNTDKNPDDTTSDGTWKSPVGYKGTIGAGGVPQGWGKIAGRNIHDGIDFGYNSGWEHKIKAAHDGTVVYVGYNAEWAHGMIVTHAKGEKYWVVYQEYSNNWESDTLVKKGDTVKTGDHIANLTNDHLHLGIAKSKAIGVAGNGSSTAGFYNPLSFIKGLKVAKGQNNGK